MRLRIGPAVAFIPPLATVAHLAFGFAGGRLQAGGARATPKEYLLYGALAALPDIDLLASVLGHPGALRHRGPTHSLLFAASVACAVALLPSAWRSGWPRLRTSIVAFLTVASHGLLDPLITGSGGTAILWPFSRALFSWGAFQPIPDAFSGFAWPFFSPRRLLLEAVLFAPLFVYALWPRTRAEGADLDAGPRSPQLSPDLARE